MKLSVIVPVYNVGFFLEKCIKSLIDQSFLDMEIVIVDDGSTDNSLEVCQSFSSRINNLRVIHKQNGGLVSAWKAGLVAAQGDFIGFVDGDDFVDQNMFERLLHPFSLFHDLDIVMGGLTEVDEFSNFVKRTRCSPYLESGYYSRDQIQEKILNMVINDGRVGGRIFLPSRVTKVFRKSLLMENFSFFSEDVSIGEDLLVSYACVRRSRGIFIMNDMYLYYYRRNPYSMSNEIPWKYYEKTKPLFLSLSNLKGKENPNLETQISNNHISLSLNSVEKIVLNKTVKFAEKIASIKKIIQDPMFLYSHKNGNFSRFSLHGKLFLFFVSVKNAIMIYFLEKAKTIIIRGCERNG